MWEVLPAWIRLQVGVEVWEEADCRYLLNDDDLTLLQWSPSGEGDLWGKGMEPVGG